MLNLGAKSWSNTRIVVQLTLAAIALRQFGKDFQITEFISTNLIIYIYRYIYYQKNDICMDGLGLEYMASAISLNVPVPMSTNDCKLVVFWLVSFIKVRLLSSCVIL